ncbi:UNVERIFIED_CONTAM: hypothetical protein FKN15_031773 [Acipenser sinensis]
MEKTLHIQSQGHFVWDAGGCGGKALSSHSAASSPVPAPEQTPASLLVAPEVSEKDMAMSEGEQDSLSIAASWDEESFLRGETQDPDLTQEMVPSSEFASEPEVPVPSSSVRALME